MLLGLCATAIEDIHEDLQHTKRAASQVYQGTKVVAQECTKVVLEAHDTVQQMCIDTNAALEQVTQHVQTTLHAANDCAEGVLAVRNELQ